MPGVAIVLVLIAAGWLLLSRAAYVRNLLAVGGDDRAAFTAGVDVRLVKLLAYALAGLLAAIAGLLLTGRHAVPATARRARPYTISSISAVALGGIAWPAAAAACSERARRGRDYLIQNC